MPMCIEVSQQCMKERKRGTCYNYVDVQFSVGVCQCIHIFVHIYVCSCMCMCSPRGAHLCHCQYVQAGSGSQLCACVQKALDALQTSAGNCNGPCPVQKTARASHLQAKWPYPEDINLHLGQQQHEQQGDETGCRQVHHAWLSVRTGSTRYFQVHLNTYFFQMNQLLIYKIGLIPRLV